MQQSQTETKWYARVLGRELGPMTAQRLKRMVLEGEITPEDQIRRSDESQWSSAASFIPTSKPKHLEVLEPVVSTIAPLRVPKGNSEARIASIRERALAARAPFSQPETNEDQFGLETLDSGSVSNPPTNSERESGDSCGDPLPFDVEEPSPDDVVPALESTPLSQAIAASSTPPRPSRSFDGMVQGVGRAIRVRTSRRSPDGPGLQEFLGGLIPRRLFTPTAGIVAVCVLVVFSIVWLMTPSYQGEAFDRMAEIRQSVQNALDEQMTWDEAMRDLRPEVTEIADRMESVATSDEPSSQVLLWASQQMIEVISGSVTNSGSRLEKYDQLISEYLLLTTGKKSGPA